MMKAEKFGDWDLVLALANNMERDVKDANVYALKGIADKAQKIAKGHINDQDLPWKELSPEYLKQKEASGMSNKIYEATSALNNAIESRLISNKESFAGIGFNKLNQTGESLVKISTIMEYGSVSQNIPARPLWRPTYIEMVVVIKKLLPFSRETIRRWKMRTNGKG